MNIEMINSIDHFNLCLAGFLGCILPYLTLVSQFVSVCYRL